METRDNILKKMIEDRRLREKDPIEYERRIREREERRKKENDDLFAKMISEDPYKLPNTLYHGTNAKLVRLSSAERQSYFETCHRVVDLLYPFYEGLTKDDINMDCVKELFEDDNLRYLIAGDVSNLKRYREGHPWYQYGAFYLARDPGSAINYALRSFAGGEFGRFTWSLIRGAEIIDFDGLKQNRAYLEDTNRVIQFVNLPDEPVVFAFQHLDIRNLKLSSGDDISWNKFAEEPYFRYYGEIELDLSKAGYLDTDKRYHYKSLPVPY